VPIGAALVAEHVAAQIFAGDHGSTYGGNLLSTRAGIYVLSQLMDEGLLDHVREVGARLEAELLALASRHTVIAEVRGGGVMRGIELKVDATPVIEGALKAGLLVNRTDERVVRLLPPLTVTHEEIAEAVSILDTVLAGLSAEGKK
jgi:acetylornithine/N-succinyldiaminopimelate aminotransferase